MNGSTSRARMGDIKAMHKHSHPLSPSKHAYSTSALSASASDFHLSPLRPSPPGAGEHAASSASLLHSSSSSGGSGGGLSSRSHFKSIAVACEIRLKECIERSRVADRLLRAPPTIPSTSSTVGGLGTDASAGDHRSTSEGLIDRSISALALTMFDILHELKDAFPSQTLYTQFVTVLDQLMWSAQTRLVTIEPSTLTHQPHKHNTASAISLALSHAVGTAGSSSTASLHHSFPSTSSLSSAPAPVASATPVIERLTNYELNLLHARNDDSWRANFHAASSRESDLSSRVSALQAENDALRADLEALSKDTTSSRDYTRELERVVQSLDGRLRLMQEAQEILAGQRSALERHASEQEEVILHERQQGLSLRKALEAAQSSWAANDAQDALKAQLHQAEAQVLKVEEQLHSVNALYHAMHATAHNTILKKEHVATELAQARKQIEQLTQNRADILRPYTPRPEWLKLYRAHLCDLTPTLMLNAGEASSGQIHNVLACLQAKDVDILALQDTLAQTLEVHQTTKTQLAKAKRDLEIAIRQGIAAQNRIRAAGLAGGGGDGSGVDGSGTGSDSSRVLVPMSFSKPKSTSRYFIGAGTGPQVPPFLRAVGKVRNRHLSKKDTETTVREVWNKKQAHDKERGRLDLNLSDFFALFLKTKYGLGSLVAEAGYNLLDALERYRWDADCELFLKVLRGEVPEEAYYDQVLLMQTLTNMFMALEVIRSERKAANLVPGTTTINTLPLDYLSKVLRLLFPAKSPEAFEAIVGALSTCFLDAPRSATDYSLLFRNDRTMNETGFIEEVRDQHLYEIENLCIQLTEEIVLLPRVMDDPEEDRETMAIAAAMGMGPSASAAAAAASAVDVPREGKVRIYDVHNVWIRLDPHITVEQMDRFICRALRLPSGPGCSIDPTTLVTPSEFCRALFSMNLITYHLNFDPTAPSKLSSIPLPDVLPPSAISAAPSAGAGAGAGTSLAVPAASGKSGSKGDRRATQSNRRASMAPGATAAAATSSTAAASSPPVLAVPSGGDSEESKSSSSESTGPLSPSKSKEFSFSVSSNSNGGPKQACLLTSPKILRLRGKFGLLESSASPELMFLERGPSFLDPASSSSMARAGVPVGGGVGGTGAVGGTAGTDVVDTLLAEKFDLDAQRFGERVRIQREKETSLKAIQGIGPPVRRRGSTIAPKNAANAIAVAPSPAVAAIVGSQEEKSLSRASSHASVASSPDSTLDSASSSAPADSAAPTLSVSSSTASLASVSSAVAAPASAVASVSSPTPRYKSSFFSPPEMHAADAIHERVATAPGQPPQHAKTAAAFKRRYTDRGNIKGPGAVAAAIEQQQQQERQSPPPSVPETATAAP